MDTKKEEKIRIALTGHRPKRLKNQEHDIEMWINNQLSKYNCEEAYSGMASGADQIFATAAINQNIPLICCYPFPKEFYHKNEIEIIKKAKKVKYISDSYSKQSYWIRDKYMVDNCDILLAVFDGIKKGGTWITIEYAKKIKKPIIYYNFRGEKDVV